MGTRRPATDAGSASVPVVRTVEEAVEAVTRRTVLAASGLAAVSVLAAATVRIALNAGVLSGTAGFASPFVEGTALVCPAGAALCGGIAAPTVRERIGLSSVGVFGLLAGAVPAAVVPAASATVAGGVLALSTRFEGGGDGRAGRTNRTKRASRTERASRGDRTEGRAPTTFGALAVGAVLCGAVLALAAGTTLLPASLRGPGSALALCGFALTPALVRPSRRAWSFGLVAGVGVLLVGVVAPFVTGAVTLVAWAVVDVSVALIALGLAGLVATVVAGFERRETPTVVGGVLLLGAGVPATVPRALAAVLGLWLLAGGVELVRNDVGATGSRGGADG